MKKYLDILLFTLLFFFIFSYFTGDKQAPVKTWIQFQVVDNSLKVPAGIILNVQNNTSEVFKFNTCDNLETRLNGQLIEYPQEFCEDRTVALGETNIINLAPNYELFETPWNYIFKLTQNDKEYLSTVDVEYRGTLWKAFVGLFYAPIYNLMAYLIHFFGNSLGFAIISITIIIRVLLLFPQHKMLVSQRKMQAIQPKIKKLQEKHKWNQQQIGVELMKLYKDEWVNPMWSCGFLIIQMPILLVIYRIIIDIMSLKNEFYLYDFLPEFHISQIDPIFFGMDLLASGWLVWILLALSVAAIQFVQVKLSIMHKAKADTTTGVVLEKKKDSNSYSSMMPDPELMNKFMLYGMPVMVGIFTYTLIAWVGLYWWISTLFAILQQLFVNKIIKK